MAAGDFSCIHLQYQGISIGLNPRTEDGFFWPESFFAEERELAVFKWQPHGDNLIAGKIGEL